MGVGGELEVTSSLLEHMPNAAELPYPRTLRVLETEKTAGASGVALPHGPDWRNSAVPSVTWDVEVAVVFPKAEPVLYTSMQIMKGTF